MTHAAAPQTARHILCMKWGRKYGPEYVNRLYGMARDEETKNGISGLRPEPCHKQTANERKRVVRVA